MKYTNTRRAAMGAAAILIFGMVIVWRRWGQAMGQQDYLLIGAALFLVALNLGMSYYFDRQNYLKQQPKKK